MKRRRGSQAGVEPRLNIEENAPTNAAFSLQDPRHAKWLSSCQIVTMSSY